MRAHRLGSEGKYTAAAAAPRPYLLPVRLFPLNASSLRSLLGRGGGGSEVDGLGLRDLAEVLQPDLLVPVRVHGLDQCLCVCALRRGGGKRGRGDCEGWRVGERRRGTGAVQGGGGATHVDIRVGDVSEAERDEHLLEDRAVHRLPVHGRVDLGRGEGGEGRQAR